MFADKNHTFLKKSVNEETLTKVSATISSIKASAKEYGIEEEALPKGAKEIQEKKKAIEGLVKEARAKLSIQEAAGKLFVNGVSDWQKTENTVIIKEELKETDIGKIRENLSLFDDSSWKKNVDTYLGYADAQVKRISELKASFDRMLKDGTVTSAVTYEDYLAAVDSISQIRNEKEKEKFSALAEKVAQQMGYGANYYDNTSTDETIYY